MSKKTTIRKKQINISPPQRTSKLSTLTPNPGFSVDQQSMPTMAEVKALRLKQEHSGHSLGNISLQSNHNRHSLLTIQPKLTIGQPGDKYEQEADKVATQVVNKINSPQPVGQRQEMPEEEDKELQTKPVSESIQRQEMPEEEEEELQTKSLSESIQRQDMPEEEEELQTKPHGHAQSQFNNTNQLEQSIQQAKGGGQALDNKIKTKMEQGFGTDFSGVRIHTNSHSDILNRSLEARAFTTGQDVFFRQGEYNPTNRSGQELIAHELTHVVQQTKR
jgi:hypothetical protein